MKRLMAALFLLSVSATASAKNMYIPIAAYIGGANSTYFRSDVRIFNPSYVHDISVTLHFLPQGMDGRNISGRIVVVPHRQMAVLDNVVEDFLDWPVEAVGAIRLDSDTDFSYEFSAESRTYTNSPNPAAPGTYGQFIPALDPANAMLKSVVLHVKRNEAFRTNPGAMNPGQEPAMVTPFLVKPDGALLSEGAAFEVPPQSMVQMSIAQMFGTVPDFEDGFILFDSTAPVFTWASVLDNQSGDQTFVLGAEDKEGVMPIP